MKWRTYLPELFSNNRLGKIMVMCFQVFSWWQYCTNINFTYQNNMFTTFPITGANFLMANLAWLLYYLGGEFYLINLLQTKLLAANPLVVIRNEKRTTIFQNCLLTIVLFSLVYNLLFISLIVIMTKNKLNYWFLVKLFSTLWLSFTVFILFALTCSLIERILGWIIPLLLSVISLALKSNYLIMVTNSVTWSVNISNAIWFIVLIILLEQINQRLETK